MIDLQRELNFTMQLSSGNMITLYPHTLNCVKSGTTEVIDGVPVTGEPTLVTRVCRYRPNTSAKSVKGADGNTVIYRGTCYTPETETEIVTGDIISVEGQISEAEVLQVYNAQFRTRIILK